MKKVAFVLMAMIIVLFLVGGASAGKVTSSSGGISSSQSGVGLGSASKVGAAGHSAYAEVLLEETLTDPVLWPPTGGSFDITTSGEEEMTDDIVTVKAEADELHITGELIPGLLPGSTVESHAHVWAEGDETGVTGVYVDSEVDAYVDLDLMPGAEGKASAYAAGTATGSGSYLGMEVSSSADGTVDVSAEAEGSIADGAEVELGGFIEGYADLEDSGQYLETYSELYTDMNLNYDASGEATVSGSAKSSADATDLSGKSAASGTVATEGKALGNEGIETWAEIEGYQEHIVATDDQDSYAYIASDLLIEGFEDSLSASGEASASGQASVSGQDNVAPALFPISSMSNSAEGSVEVTAEQEGQGTTDLYAEIDSYSVLKYDDTFYYSDMFDPASPGMMWVEFELDATSLLYDSGSVYGWADFVAANPGYDAEATVTADGETSSDATYALHSSETATDGSALVDAVGVGEVDYYSEAGLYAANALASTVTSSPSGGTFNPWVMSVSSLYSGSDDWTYHSTPVTIDGEAEASGEAAASATFNNGVNIANGETYADGAVSGLVGGSELAGLFTAGHTADDYFVTLDGGSTDAGGFLTADAGLGVYLSAGNAGGWDGLNFANTASGKAGANGDVYFPDAIFTGDTAASGKVTQSTKAPCEEYVEVASGAIIHSAVRDYYDSTSEEHVTKSQTESVAYAGQYGDEVGSATSQKVSFSGAKAGAEGSVEKFGDFTVESASTLAGTGTVELTAKDESESEASARIYSLATTTHNYNTEADQGRIDAYYQTYFSGDDNANQKAKVQLSGVTITDEVAVTDQDGSVADSSESAALSLKKGTSKIEVNTGSNKVKITFPYVNAKITGQRDAADPEIGERVQSETYQTWSADPNVVYARWRARVDTNVQNPAPIVPPQP